MGWVCVLTVIGCLGRTGRAEREGKAVTYFTDEDAPFLKTLDITFPV